MLVLCRKLIFKNDVPDTVVNMPGCMIYRRDRNWSGRDLRNKGGIAIYTRNNLSVIGVFHSNLNEFICLTVSLLGIAYFYLVFIILRKQHTRNAI